MSTGHLLDREVAEANAAGRWDRPLSLRVDAAVVDEEEKHMSDELTLNPDQVSALKRVVDFLHRQGARHFAEMRAGLPISVACNELDIALTARQEQEAPVPPTSQVCKKDSGELFDVVGLVDDGDYGLAFHLVARTVAVEYEGPSLEGNERFGFCVPAEVIPDKYRDGRPTVVPISALEREFTLAQPLRPSRPTDLDDLPF